MTSVGAAPSSEGQPEAERVPSVLLPLSAAGVELDDIADIENDEDEGGGNGVAAADAEGVDDDAGV